MPTSVTELTNASSPGQDEDLSTNLSTRVDLRFGKVDLEGPPIGQETMAPSVVTLLPFWYLCRSVAKHSHSFAIQVRPRF